MGAYLYNSVQHHKRENPDHDSSFRQRIGAPVPRRQACTERITFNDQSVTTCAWPSRGGVIQLERVTALDLEFLGIHPVDPDIQRDPNQEEEDKLCQRLLLLGAKWFDGEARRELVTSLYRNSTHVLDAVRNGDKPSPSPMERKWVSVAYPTDEPEGGFWVAEFDIALDGFYSPTDLGPDNVPLVQLARSMSEEHGRGA